MIIVAENIMKRQYPHILLFLNGFCADLTVHEIPVLARLVSALGQHVDVGSENGHYEQGDQRSERT